uniref:Uncharacterized protein n=1 Tax=Anguilla anguilla TaxID=7936 RepID=A0A0E9WIT9_ANGAN
MSARAGTHWFHLIDRLGRWWRIKDAKNGLYIIPLKKRDSDQEATSSE